MNRPNELVLETKHRVFFFGEQARYHVHVIKEHGRERWLWQVYDAHTDSIRCLAPIAGWEKREDAYLDVSDFLTALGVKLTPTN